MNEKKRPCSPVNGVPLPRGKPFTSGEAAREAGRKGAARANAVKAARKTLREQLEILLSEKTPSGRSVQEQITLSILKQATEGNTKAFEIIRDTIGQKPAEHIEMTLPDFAALDAIDYGQN